MAADLARCAPPTTGCPTQGRHRHRHRRSQRRPHRTFLYDNPAARDLISAAITRTVTRRQHDPADRDAQAEASWQQRALNAEQALKTAHAEIRAQRARIGELRDTQREHDHDALQRLTAENTTLKQRLRQLTSDQRAMEESCKPPAPTTASSISASPASKPSFWTPT